jgi:hypothetical protein
MPAKVLRGVQVTATRDTTGSKIQYTTMVDSYQHKSWNFRMKYGQALANELGSTWVVACSWAPGPIDREGN